MRESVNEFVVLKRKADGVLVLIYLLINKLFLVKVVLVEMLIISEEYVLARVGRETRVKRAFNLFKTIDNHDFIQRDLLIFLTNLIEINVLFVSHAEVTFSWCVYTDDLTSDCRGNLLRIFGQLANVIDVEASLDIILSNQKCPFANLLVIGGLHDTAFIVLARLILDFPLLQIRLVY